MANRKHYHVLQGLIGLYMPNDNVVATSRQTAQRIAGEHVRNARDDGYKVKGNAVLGFWTVGEDECIEITECTVSDCLEAGND
jgi:hypothetical protein